MLEFHEGLVVELTAIAGLSGKVYPMTADQGAAMPYLVYMLGGGERFNTLAGYDGLVDAEYQLDIYHSTAAALKALKKLVIAKVKTFNNRNIGTTGPLIQSVEILTDFETSEYVNGETRYKGIVEIKVSYQE